MYLLVMESLQNILYEICALFMFGFYYLGTDVETDAKEVPKKKIHGEGREISPIEWDRHSEPAEKEEKHDSGISLFVDLKKKRNEMFFLSKRLSLHFSVDFQLLLL